MRYLVLLLSLLTGPLNAQLKNSPNEAVSPPSTVVEQEEREAVGQQLTDYFFAAARTGNTEVLDTFIAAGFPVNVQNHKGYTALMVATYHGQTKAFDLLLTKKASPCIQDQRGNTALMAAIFRGEVTMAYRLMGSDCDNNHKNYAGQTAEEFARVFGRETILEQLESL